MAFLNPRNPQISTYDNFILFSPTFRVARPQKQVIENHSPNRNAILSFVVVSRLPYRPFAAWEEFAKVRVAKVHCATLPEKKHQLALSFLFQPSLLRYFQEQRFSHNQSLRLRAISNMYSTLYPQQLAIQIGHDQKARYYAHIQFEINVLTSL